MICYHPKFNDDSIINKLKYCKGLSYFLNGFQKNQKEIIQFINHCKKHETTEGYIKQDFFDYNNYIYDNYNRSNIEKIMKKSVNNYWDHYTEEGYRLLTEQILLEIKKIQNN